MPATDAPYQAADAVTDARRLLTMAEQHAPFSAAAAGALRDVADAYTRLAAVLARPEQAIGTLGGLPIVVSGDAPKNLDGLVVEDAHTCEWRGLAERALKEREQETERADTAEVRAGQAEAEQAAAEQLRALLVEQRQRADTAEEKAKAMLFRAECAENADRENAARADKAECQLAEMREEMFRVGSLLAKQCDRIDAAEAAGYPMLGNRYLDRNGEEWTVGTNGLMHHHSYSQRSFEEVRREYGPLKRNDRPAMVRAGGAET